MTDKAQDSYVSEKIVSMIFEQVKGASEDTARTVGELAEGITELIIKVGNTPSETLVIVKKIEDLVKDLERDSKSIKKDLEKLEILKNNIFGLDKKLDTVSSKIDNIDTKLSPIDNYRNYLKKISDNMWKFYTVIGVAFLLGMALIGIVIYLQHSVTDLTKALETVQGALKSLPPKP